MESLLRISAAGVAILILASIPVQTSARTSVPGSYQKAVRLAINGSVTPQCKLRAEPLKFTPYDATGENQVENDMQRSDLVISCTAGTKATLHLDAGQHAGAVTRSLRALKLRDGSDFLGYDLCHDVFCATPWTTANASDAIYSPSSDKEGDVQVFGRISPGQDVAVGFYEDSLTATINF